MIRSRIFFKKRLITNSSNQIGKAELWIWHTIAMVGARRAAPSGRCHCAGMWTRRGLALTRAHAMRPYQTHDADLWTRHTIAMVGTRSRSLHTPGCVPRPLDDAILQACGRDTGWR
ncbi:MAG: hypothetical protein ACYDH2_02370 [Anaerolineaceae bacterium]